MNNRRQRRPLPTSPYNYGSQREQGSPTKAAVLLQQDHAQYIQSLHNRKDNFCTCLDLYRVSYDNDLPQKCLIHNNFITLYCQNEFKLLCVNCIYGSAIHKDHRVVPSKNSIPSVARDNEDNLRILEEELERIKHVEVEMRKNKRVLEEECSAMLKQIDEEFKQIYMMIERKHNQTRQRAAESFNRTSSLTETGLTEMVWWKELLAKTRSTFPKSSMHEETQIYKHLVLNLFMQEKIDEEKLTYLPSGQEIRAEFMRQISELRETIEQQVGGGSSYYSQKPKARMF